jgi:hypothetical protein
MGDKETPCSFEGTKFSRMSSQMFEIVSYYSGSVLVVYDRFVNSNCVTRSQVLRTKAEYLAEGIVGVLCLSRKLYSTADILLVG